MNATATPSINKINGIMVTPSITEQQISDFAEGLYSQMIQNLSNQSSIFCLLINEDAVLPEYPGLTTANLRNVLLGGKSSGKATVDELIQARAVYDSPIHSLSQSLFLHDNPFLLPAPRNRNADQKRIHLSSAITMNEKDLISHLVLSTSIITNRIWSEQEKKRYIPKINGRELCLP